MLSRNSFEFDLNVSFHGSSEGADVLLSVDVINNDIDFILDVLVRLFSTHPGWSSSQLWNVVFLSDLVFVTSPENVKTWVGFFGWLLDVDELVKVVVHNFAQVDHGSFLNLYLACSVKLQTGGVDEAHISDVVFAINAHDHELRLPKFLVVWNMVVTGFTLSQFEKSSISMELHVQAFQLLGISLIEAKHQSLVWDFLALDRNMLPAEIAVTEFADLSELDIFLVFAERWLILQSVQA